MPRSSYSGCKLLHSYLTCSLKSESYEPVCFKVFLEKSMEHLLSYKEVKKKQGNEHWWQEIYFDLDVYMAQPIFI